jgi:hypothetical protein
MNQLLLYVTDSCHLCEQAQQVIVTALGRPVAEVDIITDDELLERYGVRIPVLRELSSGAELDWPFGHDQVVAFTENFK